MNDKPGFFESNFFVFAAWLAAKAIRMRAKAMLKAGVYVNTTLPLGEYGMDILDGDFSECVHEFLHDS